MNRKRILLIGGTGSMGFYLTELLLKQNYQVEVAAIAPGEIQHPNLQYFILDARDIGNLTRLLETHPDAVIDFLDYKPAEYRKRCELFLRNTKHLFLPLQLPGLHRSRSGHHGRVAVAERRRTRPRIPGIPTTTPFTRRKTKRSCAPCLTTTGPSSGPRSSSRNSVCRDFARRQLHLQPGDGEETGPDRRQRGRGTEYLYLVRRCCQTLCRTALRPDTFRETYSLCTGEHRTWGEWAKAYRELIGLETWTIPQEEFEGIYWNRAQWALYQFRYDRMLNRVLDNSKVLKAAGLTQSDLTPVWKALEFELRRFPATTDFPAAKSSTPTWTVILPAAVRSSESLNDPPLS